MRLSPGLNRRIVLHLLLPFLPAAAFFTLICTTPDSALARRTRGLLALAMALVSGLAAMGTVGTALFLKARSRTGSSCWVASTLLLALPAAARLLLV